jgi:bifunctional UDP-N-acetylglucosamine pyrophosphorylase / glucosamine-1-phosphate N-acetyltransferase
MSLNPLNVVILAAGKGTRMRSSKPKVLHKLADKPLLQHVVDVAKSLHPQKIIVIYGFGGEAVLKAFPHEDLVWVEQKQQLGTGHAMMQALPHLNEDGSTLILLGDVPLIHQRDCKNLLDEDIQVGLLTTLKEDPTGYGRIIRTEQGEITSIVEHKDANESQRYIQEVNTGIIYAKNALLKPWISQLGNQNAQGEYYLTDIMSMAVKAGIKVCGIKVQDHVSVEGVNSQSDLAHLERVYQIRCANDLMEKGVVLKDPNRIDVRGQLTVGQDVEIDVGCIFEGQVVLGNGVKIGPYAVIKDSQIGDLTEIKAFSHIDQALIETNAVIGPYARIRPGTKIGPEAHVGNFVEVKMSELGRGTKANHLSYIGDAKIGQSVNIGAGTITCNYDGVNKHQTIIEDHVFVGSDTQLVAPVKLGQGSTIGAGSTITKNVPEHSLTVCRAKEQKSILGWKKSPKKEK